MIENTTCVRSLGFFFVLQRNSNDFALISRLSLDPLLEEQVLGNHDHSSDNGEGIPIRYEASDNIVSGLGGVS